MKKMADFETPRIIIIGLGLEFEHNGFNELNIFSEGSVKPKKMLNLFEGASRFTRGRDVINISIMYNTSGFSYL